jgi:hypothetical protein
MQMDEVYTEGDFQQEESPVCQRKQNLDESSSYDTCLSTEQFGNSQRLEAEETSCRSSSADSDHGVSLVFPCSGQVRMALVEGLLHAGFKAVGENVFLEAKTDVTVELSPDILEVHWGAASHNGQDIACFVADALAVDAAGSMFKCASQFGSELLGFIHEDCIDDKGPSTSHDDMASSKCSNNGLHLDLSLLPTVSSLCISIDRTLTLVTYGCNVMNPRPQAQRYYCLDDRRIRYRLSGREAAKLCGLDEIIQARVCRCGFFAVWLSEITSDIEKYNLERVAIFCWKGRHRSVAAAEILKRVYYPRAHVQHLCL